MRRSVNEANDRAAASLKQSAAAAKQSAQRAAARQQRQKMLPNGLLNRLLNGLLTTRSQTGRLIAMATRRHVPAIDADDEANGHCSTPPDHKWPLRPHGLVTAIDALRSP